MRLASVLSAAALASAAPPTVIVDLVTGAPPLPLVLAAQVSVGLLNRDTRGAAYYTLMHDEDAAWFAVAEPGVAPPPAAPAAAAVAAALARGAARGWLLYNFSAQQALVPNVLTVAAALDLVPLEAGSPLAPAGVPPLFDATAAWAGLDARGATAWAFARFGNATTTMAKVNPGYDVHAHPLAPTLAGAPDLSLADYIVSARLFAFWMTDSCIPGTAEHALMEAMVKAPTPWPRPIAVWGYDDSWAVAGDVFEAETTCVAEHGLGQVATVGVNGLSYFSRAPRVAAPLAPSPPRPRAVFNASKVYVALVVGDGDNVAFLKGARRDWMGARVARCAGAAPRCFPLLWTLSPHVLYAAPAIARFYAAEAAKSGADFFALPPSGALYSYPSQMAPRDAAAFVAATEAAAALLNTSATVHWEFAGTWPEAIAGFAPRYGPAGVVRALFATNVPYMLPAAAFGPGEHFKVVANASTVVFAPLEWRGTSGAADPALHPFLLSPAEQAARVGAFARGSVAALYLTSDGGAQIDDLFQFAGNLSEHVEIVGLDAAQLALDARAAGAA